MCRLQTGRRVRLLGFIFTSTRLQWGGRGWEDEGGGGSGGGAEADGGNSATAAVPAVFSNLITF